jgi:hypothetical protein
VKDLAAAGTEERIVLAACSSLGKERAFPGYLKQRVSELEEAGGPCEHDGLDRSKLSLAELQGCADQWSRVARQDDDGASAEDRVDRAALVAELAQVCARE